MGKIIEIIPSTVRHVLDLRKSLREGDRNEILRMGDCVRDALWRTFNDTNDPKTVLVNGEVGAMFGCGGTVIGDVGNPWLLTAKISEETPLLFVKIYRNEVHKMLARYSRLENVVDASYGQAIKLLEMVGFKCYNAEPIGKNGDLFRKFELRREWLC